MVIVRNVSDGSNVRARCGPPHHVYTGLTLARERMVAIRWNGRV